VRALLAVMTIALAAGWVGIRHLPADAQAEPVTLNARPQEIRSVSLDGDRGLPMAALRDVLETKAGGLIDLAAIKRDRAALQAVLIERGYLAATVGDARVTFGAGGVVYVTFPIQQGPVFRLRNITVEGASATEAGIVTFAGGDVADAERIARARKAVEERLRVRGKQHVVEASLSLDAAAGVADLTLSAR